MSVNPETTTRKLVSLPKAMVQEIKNFRFDHRIDTESEAIRRLIEAGLRASDVSASEAHRQSQVVAASAQADEDQAFIDAASDWGDA
jgi:metal-responsive CopG/Arc/MetJ family transcriptional regulator